MLLARQPFAAEAIDEVILGCAAPSVDEVNIGRVAALRMGCGKAVPAWTVMRNCASGMQSLDSAMANIQSGRASLVLAGGVDALSRTPLIYNEAMTLWFSKLAAARSLSQRAAVFARLPLAAMFNPARVLPAPGPAWISTSWPAGPAATSLTRKSWIRRFLNKLISTGLFFDLASPAKISSPDIKLRYFPSIPSAPPLLQRHKTLNAIAALVAVTKSCSTELVEFVFWV